MKKLKFDVLKVPNDWVIRKISVSIETPEVLFCFYKNCIINKNEKSVSIFRWVTIFLAVNNSMVDIKWLNIRGFNQCTILLTLISILQLRRMRECRYLLLLNCTDWLWTYILLSGSPSSLCPISVCMLKYRRPHSPCAGCVFAWYTSKTQSRSGENSTIRLLVWWKIDYC